MSLGELGADTPAWRALEHLDVNDAIVDFWRQLGQFLDLALEAVIGNAACWSWAL